MSWWCAFRERRRGANCRGYPVPVAVASPLANSPTEDRTSRRTRGPKYDVPGVSGSRRWDWLVQCPSWYSDLWWLATTMPSPCCRPLSRVERGDVYFFRLLGWPYSIKTGHALESLTTYSNYNYSLTRPPHAM